MKPTVFRENGSRWYTVYTDNKGHSDVIVLDRFRHSFIKEPIVVLMDIQSRTTWTTTTKFFGESYITRRLFQEREDEAEAKRIADALEANKRIVPIVVGSIWQSKCNPAFLTVVASVYQVVSMMYVATSHDNGFPETRDEESFRRIFQLIRTF